MTLSPALWSSQMTLQLLNDLINYLFCSIFVCCKNPFLCGILQLCKMIFFVYYHWQDNEIRTNATLYLPQISELLNRVPRQMLLLLKTNDLLRGIETTLQTRASSSSFINMSRCCIRALARWRKWHFIKLQFTQALSAWPFQQVNYALYVWKKKLCSARQNDRDDQGCVVFFSFNQCSRTRKWH